MRKILILTAMMLCSVFSYSREIPLEKAYDIAERFFAGNDVTKGGGSAVNLLWDGRGVSTRSDAGAPSFYVFGRENCPGFVVVSGDDAMRPILAWSDDTEFNVENIPGNALWWFESINDQVAYLRECSAAPYAGGLAEDKSEFLVPTASWGQNDPYNQECPLLQSGVRTVTGCVATAMAIVMHQRQWPDAGVGVFPEYTTRNGVKVKGRIPGKYNWKSLPLSDAASSGWPANLNDDIARIMADCGTSIQANYGYPETSASEVTAADVFVNHMKYDKSVHMDWKGYYTDDEWADLLKSELHTNGAILYTADNDKAGHAFVIDGYSSEGLFHVNWGWNGAANAYYSLDNMNGDPKNPYNYDHVIIAGLKPDEGGQSIERILFYSSEEFPGVIVESRNSESGVPTMVSLGGFWNKGSESYTGKFRFGVFDREMNLVEQLWITDIEGLRPSFKVVYEDVPVEITDVDFGYSLVAQFYNNVTKEWEKVRASSEYDGVTEILLADEYSIEESTVFAYSEADDAILITTKDGVAVSCGTAAGKNVPIKEVSPNEYRIDVAPLGAEVYVLRLEKGKEVVEVEFVTER